MKIKEMRRLDETAKKRKKFKINERQTKREQGGGIGKLKKKW